MILTTLLKRSKTLTIDSLYYESIERRWVLKVWKKKNTFALILDGVFFYFVRLIKICKYHDDKDGNVVGSFLQYPYQWRNSALLWVGFINRTTLGARGCHW